MPLPFADVMEVALALLALSPDELAALGWSFAARKRLLEHFLAADKQADVIERTALDRAVLTLRLPLRDVRRLQHFTRRELPKMASRADVIDRLDAVLERSLAQAR
ncbi:hypothetical protein [Sphingomonas sp.]|uniref:hypothetical protein n=1 Tax=Sphingomonas sp. TaxID=28214 RepID=UPI0025EB5154|nr:hypothetical protein [Sphingomonas sp.]